MPSERSKRAIELFNQVRELDSELKARVLDSACKDDPELRSEVESLLKHSASEEGLLSEQDFLVSGVLGEGALTTPTQIGEYRVVEILAHGSTCSVYRGEEPPPFSRTVAIKLLEDTSALATARFEAEERLLAQLDHPSIVRLLGGGTTPNGKPYFAMQYVGGLSVVEFCDREKLPLKERLLLFVEIVDAIMHCHERGVFHLDLKPTNVLVTIRHGKAIPKLIDFGISRQRLPAGIEPREDGSELVAGTPGYMSPEQRVGEIIENEVASDIHALGILLGELLAGRAPSISKRKVGSLVEWFSELPLAERAAISEKRRLTPEALERILKASFETLFARAVDHSSTRRFRSALELKETLVRAAVDDGKQRGSRFSFRGAASFGLGALFTALAVVAVQVLFQEYRRDTEREAPLGIELEGRAIDKRTREALIAASQLEKIERELLADSLALPGGTDNEASMNEVERLLGSLREFRQTLARVRTTFARDELAEREIGPNLRSSTNAQSTIELELSKTRMEIERLTQAQTKPEAVTILPPPLLRSKRPLTYYIRSRFAVSKETALTRIEGELRLQDGAVLRLDGKELWRIRVKEGLILPLTPATRASDVEVEPLELTLTEPLVLQAGRREVSVEVHRIAPLSPRFAFALKLNCVSDAGETLLIVTEESDWEIKENGPEAAFLGKAPIGFGFTKPELRLGELLAREKALLASKDLPSSSAITTGESFRFRSRVDQAVHDRIATLVDKLDEIGAKEPPLARISTLRRLREKRTAPLQAGSLWTEAIQQIADVNLSPAYDGIVLEKDDALVPLGSNPRTGLFEFLLQDTGERPVRLAHGELEVSAACGIVFVLLPGGTFRMGTSIPEGIEVPRHKKPRDHERPAHDVTLDPFFVSKYEITQAQWFRMTGARPSVNREVTDRAELQLLHPVENVSWEAVVEVLNPYGLSLPTEAQFEYALRGGTTTTWWTGEDAATHARSENLASEFEAYLGHSPIATFEPNLFGLFDTAGNVWEWTAERLLPFDVPARPGDGLRRPVAAEDVGRAIRGGGFDYDPNMARSSVRNAAYAKQAYYNVGFRPIRTVRRARG